MKSVSAAQGRWMERRLIGLAALTVAIVALIAYFPILSASFYGDDWIFYELAGRLNLLDYLVKYFDPRVQTAWYRPVQGLLFRIGYLIWGTNPAGYHLTNLLFHVGNCLLLFALVRRALGRWRVAFAAAILFASFPWAVQAVFWPGVIDPVITFFALLAGWFWLNYLRFERARDYWLAWISFIGALFSKEIAVMLPIILFAIDRFFVSKAISIAQWVRRYFWFGGVFLIYLPIEYIVTRRSVFVSREGYNGGMQIISNLIDYLSGLAFPWQLPTPLDYTWLVLVLGMVVYLLFVKRRLACWPLLAIVVLPLLPVLPFPFVAPRFGYFSLTAVAIFYALGLDWLERRGSQRSVLFAIGLLVALLVTVGSAGVSRAAVDFGEYARVARVPFRNISQKHPDFVNDTLIYFINPPVPRSNLSGMFFWRYGARVVVQGSDTSAPAGLREHAAAFIAYFDAEGNQKELSVEKQVLTHTTLPLPIDFNVPLRLEGYELANSNLKREQSVIVFLNWRAQERLDQDWVLRVDLIDEKNERVSGIEKELRAGELPTSTWLPGESMTNAVVLAIPSDASVGVYRLRIGLFDPTMQRSIGIKDLGNDTADGLLIEPLNISE